MSGPMVPAGPVRAHVQALIGEGMKQAAICRAADVTSAYMSELLYGQYNAARTPKLMTGAAIADRLLAMRYEPPAPKPERESTVCTPGDRFQPVGHRAGRCDLCGQIAPVHTRDRVQVLFHHPRPAPGAEAPQVLPAAAGARHPDCGSPRGHSRHRREKTAVCELCKAARYGYDQGVQAAIARARREAASDVPRPLAEQIVAFCRAYVLQPWPPGRPVPRSRELARQVVRRADAELVADEASRAA